MAVVMGRKERRWFVILGIGVITADFVPTYGKQGEGFLKDRRTEVIIPPDQAFCPLSINETPEHLLVLKED